MAISVVLLSVEVEEALGGVHDRRKAKYYGVVLGLTCTEIAICGRHQRHRMRRIAKAVGTRLESDGKETGRL